MRKHFAFLLLISGFINRFIAAGYDEYMSLDYYLAALPYELLCSEDMMDDKNMATPCKRGLVFSTSAEESMGASSFGPNSPNEESPLAPDQVELLVKGRPLEFGDQDNTNQAPRLAGKRKRGWEPVILEEQAASVEEQAVSVICKFLYGDEDRVNRALKRFYFKSLLERFGDDYLTKIDGEAKHAFLEGVMIDHPCMEAFRILDLLFWENKDERSEESFFNLDLLFKIGLEVVRKAMLFKELLGVQESFADFINFLVSGERIPLQDIASWANDFDAVCPLEGKTESINAKADWLRREVAKLFNELQGLLGEQAVLLNYYQR